MFFAFGAPGLLVALLVTTLREPPRSESSQDLWIERSSFLDYLRRNRRAFVPIYLALACHFMFGYAIFAWGAVLLMRELSVPPSEVGAMYGLIHLIAGAGGAVMAGWISYRFVKRWPDNGRLRVIWVYYPAVIGAYALFALAGGVEITLVAITMAVLFGGGYTARSYVMRGQAVAVYMLFGNLFGLGLAPLLVALATDCLFADEAMLHLSIVVVGLPATVLAFVLSIVALPAYARFRRTQTRASI